MISRTKLLISTITFLYCWYQELSCWYQELSCWYQELSCWYQELSCWYQELSCWYQELSCWYQELSCWYQEMPFSLVRIAMVMRSWILMRSSLFFRSALAKDGGRTSMRRKGSFLFICLSMKHENYIMAGFIYLFLLIKKKVILLIFIFIGHQVLRIA